MKVGHSTVLLCDIAIKVLSVLSEDSTIKHQQNTKY